MPQDEQNSERPGDPLADYRLSPEEMAGRPPAPEPGIIEDVSRKAYAPDIPDLGRHTIAPQPDVWPPPPGGLQAALTPAEILGLAPGRFQSTMGLSRIIIGLIASIIAFSGIAAVLDETHAATGNKLTFLFGIEGFLYFGSVIFFMMFTGRLQGNLAGFHAGGLSFDTIRASWSFLTPVFNLWTPINVYQEIWKASDPAVQSMDPFAWKRARPNPLIPYWWIAYNVSYVLEAACSVNPSTLQHMPLIFAAAQLLSGALAIAVANAVAVRQEEKRGVIEQRHAALGLQYAPPTE